MDVLVVGGLSILLVFGGYLFGIGARNVWRGLASPGWPSVVGSVTTSETSKTVTPSGTPHSRSTQAASVIYSADVRFTYSIGGAEYTTTTLHFGQTLGSGDSSDAELRHARYPVGGPVRVFYKPGDPGVAAVEPGFSPEVLWLPGAGLAILLPGVMGIILYFGMTRNADSMMGLGVGIFASIFAAIGLMLLINGLVNFRRGHASQKWPTAPATITYRAIDRHDTTVEDDDGFTQHAQVSAARLVYRYEVNGIQHFGNRRRFGQLAGAGDDWARQIAAKYPQGKEVPVAYDPSDPNLAVLETGISNEAYWIPGVGAAFLLFALAAFIWVVPSMSRGG